MNRLSDYDSRCSIACTRAGLVALLLSAMAIAMLQPLEKTRQLDSVLRYYSMRLRMQDRLDQLNTDPVWSFLKTSTVGENASKEWTLAQLLEYKVLEDNNSEFRVKPTESAPKPSEKTKSKVPRSSANLIPPTAPQNLSVFMERTIEPIHDTALTLTELDDDALLTTARLYSQQYNRSIYRWMLLRYKLTSQSTTKIVPPPSTTRDMLKYLRLPQIIELVNYEPAKEADADLLLKEQASLMLPSVGLSLTALRATSFVEMALVLMALYFWLYYREARSSENFPAPATLFGVFARTQLSRIIFSLLLMVPPVAAALLAEKSFWSTPANIIPAVLVVLIASMVVWEGDLIRLTNCQSDSATLPSTTDTQN